MITHKSLKQSLRMVVHEGNKASRLGTPRIYSKIMNLGYL